MKTKIYIFIILILVLNLFSVSAANYGGDLKIKVDQRPFNLNPLYAASDTDLMIDRQLFDTLLSYNQQGEIVSNLAESWEISNDSTLFEFKLKEEVYFHPYKINGKEVELNERRVSAEDWKWSLEYLAAAQNKSPYAELLDKVKGFTEYRQGENDEITGIRVKDKYQLEIELKESYAPFINNLAKNAAVVMPARAVMSRDSNFSLAPVGTGPFRFDDFSEDTVKLLKNNNYWKNNYQEEELPYLDQIEINFSDQSSLKENLKDFDLYQLASAEFDSYQEQKEEYGGYHITKMVKNNLYFAGLNYNNDFNQDDNYASFKESLRSIMNTGDFTKNLTADSLIVPAAEINNQSFLEKLGQKLQSSSKVNFDNNIEDLILVINDSKTNIQIANYLKNELKAKNINLKVKRYNWTEYLNNLNDRDLNGHLFIMSADYKNQFEFIFDNFYSTSKANYSGYQNDRLDNLIDYLKLVDNEQSRKRASEIVTDIIIEDNPFLFLFQRADNYLISNKVANKEIFMNIFSKNNFEKLYFE